MEGSSFVLALRSSSTTGGEHHTLINVSQNSSSADAFFDHQSDNASDGLTEYSFADRNSISEGAESAKPKKVRQISDFLEMCPASGVDLEKRVPPHGLGWPHDNILRTNGVACSKIKAFCFVFCRIRSERRSQYAFLDVESE